MYRKSAARLYAPDLEKLKTFTSVAGLTNLNEAIFSVLWRFRRPVARPSRTSPRQHSKTLKRGGQKVRDIDTARGLTVTHDNTSQLNGSVYQKIT